MAKKKFPVRPPNPGRNYECAQVQYLYTYWNKISVLFIKKWKIISLVVYFKKWTRIVKFMLSFQFLNQIFFFWWLNNRKNYIVFFFQRTKSYRSWHWNSQWMRCFNYIRSQGNHFTQGSYHNFKTVKKKKENVSLIIRNFLTYNKSGFFSSLAVYPYASSVWSIFLHGIFCSTWNAGL